MSSTEQKTKQEKVQMLVTFLLFPHCFQKASFPECLKHGIVWKRIKSVFHYTLE